jgi:ubiquinone/menaquinone biosynthesis C-methylase UbiE
MARDIDKGEWRSPEFVFRTAGFFEGIKDVFRKPKDVLEGLGIKEDQSVLDFYCGPGNFTIPAAEIVGKGGMIHALDIHPLAIEIVEEKANKRGLKNIETIFSDLETGLDRDSVDTALLYGVLYKTNNKKELIKEIGRVVKPGGLVSVSGHRMGNETLIKMMRREKFDLRDSTRGILNFTKKERINRK